MGISSFTLEVHHFKAYHSKHNSVVDHRVQLEFTMDWKTWKISQISKMEDWALLLCMCDKKIMENIIAKSSLVDIKTQRQVCRLWNEAARPILSTKAYIYLHSYSQIKDVSTNFIEMFDMQTFHKFRIGANVSLTAPVLIQFFCRFGRQVVSLKLDRLQQSDLPYLQHLLFEVLPNIEELSLDSCIIDSNVGMLPTGQNPFWMPSLLQLKRLKVHMPSIQAPKLLWELLHSSPNLEEVVSLSHPHSNMTLEDIVFLARQYIDNGWIDFLDELVEPTPVCDSHLCSYILFDDALHLDSLQKLKCKLKVGEDAINKLEEKVFPLKLLDLELVGRIQDLTMDSLLQSLSKTLETLKLHFHSTAKLTQLNCCSDLPKLRNVYLEGFQGSLMFIQYTPNLHTLTLCTVNLVEMFNNCNLCGVSCPTLRSFKVFNELCSACEPSVVAQLGKIFPNLISLRLEKLTDEGLRIVFGKWPLLEELEIESGLFTDKGTTGIHPNAYRVISREQSYDSINPDTFREALYIGHLKYLRNLKISSPSITDVTFLLGVAGCLNLQKLHILAYGITDKSLFKILGFMNLKELTTQYCHQLSAKMVEYATEYLRSRNVDVTLNAYKGPVSRNQLVEFIRRYDQARVPLVKISESTIKKWTMRTQPQPNTKAKVYKKRGRKPKKRKLT